MCIEKFYSFDSKLSSTSIQVYAIGLSAKMDGNRLFDQHRLIQGIYDNINFPLIFKQKYGKKSGDILDTGWPGLFLISGLLKSVLEDNSITGWKTYDIRVLDKQGHEINNYYGLSITGRCGPIDYSKSEIIEKRLVPHGPLCKYYKGLPVGLDKWDGSDFFLPEKNFGTIITDKAAKVLKKRKLTNISLENLAEIETPDFAVLKI